MEEVRDRADDRIARSTRLRNIVLESGMTRQSTYSGLRLLGVRVGKEVAY
jgi:hypothetical protein